MESNDGPEIQYADASEIMLDSDKYHLKVLLKPWTLLGKKSDLFLNLGKTRAIWLGSRQNSAGRYMPHLNMK